MRQTRVASHTFDLNDSVRFHAVVHIADAFTASRLRRGERTTSARRAVDE